MTLVGGRIAVNARESVQRNVLIAGSRVHRIHPDIARSPILDLTGCLILPGFINAHDHLEFNLFPRLGKGPYANATEWARDIYRPREAPIRQHLQVPKAIRLFWGAIKNLICGVTTVSHHDRYEPDVFRRRFPIRVVKRFGWAHSLHFSPDAKERFHQTTAGEPFIIHAGEGRDPSSREEIRQLESSGMLTPSTVIVHGIAFEREDLRLISQRGASLVWCPTSNCFTIGRTLSPGVFKSGIPIALGTDSALTAEGDFIDELLAASRHVDLARLYEMVTDQAARILQLHSGEGSVQERGIADLTVVADTGQTPAEALLNLRPELVILNGRIKLLSIRMAARCNFGRLPGFEVIEVQNRGRYLIACHVSALASRTNNVLSTGFRLAGKQVLC